jgi:Asp-tRNA(Asn)/Glu-tRNA(Gln) amidotransferase A subunit family amidase
MLSTLTGWPSVNIPVCLSKAGLPIGVQLIGKYWQDNLLLETALQLEKMIGFTAKPNI